MAAFIRDQRTGALRQPHGRRGCLNFDGQERCARLRRPHRGLTEAVQAVSVSPDGRRAYAWWGEEGTPRGGAVAVFARGRRTGVLRQLYGRRGCLSAERRRGCAHLRGLRGGNGSLTLSADGAHAYVAATALAIFRVGSGSASRAAVAR